MTLQPGFQMQIDLLRPFSRGSVGLRSADPHDDPVSLFNYFQDRRDMEQMVDAYHTGMELLNQPSFDAYRSRPAIAAPGHPQETDEVLLLYPHNRIPRFCLFSQQLQLERSVLPRSAQDRTERSN